MENIKKYIPITIRIIVAFLFLISAVAKMYPSPYFAISTFEVKQLYPMGFSEDLAVYFSRTLIGIEFALGLLLLQPHYLKKIVVPSTILLLVVFIIHLAIDTINNGNAGNCGCFGSLLPMTPIEAIIKNVVAAALLLWLYRLLPVDRNNFWVLTTVTFASILMVYMLAPIQPKQSEPAVEATEIIPAGNTNFTDTVAADTTQTATAVPTTAQPAETPVVQAKPATDEPKATKSIYSQYFAGADKGKKIIGLFAPGCEHCRETAKQLTEMKAKNKDFPEVQIIFMDEEAELIPDFFKFANAQYPYKIIDIITFWKVLGNANDTPGVVYLWNGNKIKEWDGINERKFVASELMKVYKKPYSEIKK